MKDGIYISESGGRVIKVSTYEDELFMSYVMSRNTSQLVSLFSSYWARPELIGFVFPTIISN
jgi:hypothetical protein